MKSNKMKILIPYDGSSYSDAAIRDLGRAGLPSEVEVVVLSVVEEKLALAARTPLDVLGTLNDSLRRQAQEQTLKAARSEVLKGAEIIESRFPSWHVSTECEVGSPVSNILSVAGEWNPDLIVVGSHGRSAIRRFFLGSVSQAIIKDALCSVRVGRSRDLVPGSATRLIIGVDGSPGSEAAVQCVIGRQWSSESEVRVLGATPLKAIPVPQEALARVAETAVRGLRDIGLSSSMTLKVGEASDLLIAEAHRWGADCIFVGASDHGRLERLLSGSTAASVAAKAGCSVEVIRGVENVSLDYGPITIATT